MSAVYYPQSALEGFGNALANRLGVSITYTTGQPRTDGGTVFLPKITGAITSDKFAALCGVAVHEAAHVYFGSVPRHQTFVNKNVAESDLRAACYNAAIDIADETRIERVLPSAADLLRACGFDAVDKIMASGSLQHGDPVWVVLASAMLSVRLGQTQVYTAMRGHHSEPLIRKAHWLLRKVRDRRPPFGKPTSQRRSGALWARIASVAEELVTLLRPIAPPQSKPQSAQDQLPEFGPAGSDTAAKAQGAPVPAGTPAASVAGKAEGESVATGTPVSAAGGSAGGTSAGSNGMVYMHGGVYAETLTPLRGAVQRMAAAEDADGAEDGFLSGPRLGNDLERARIDGRCFARRQAEGERLNVAVLLDCSGSMEYVLSRCAAVAQAFMDSLSGVAESVSAAGFGSCVRPAPNFKTVMDLGGTRTDEALRWARKALDGMRGRRVCVIITDGQAQDSVSCAAQAELLRSEGVQLIGVAFGGVRGRDLLSTMPGVRIVEAADSNELACRLSRVAQEVACV